MKKSELRQIIKEEIGKSLLNTSKYIEPENVEATLEKIYHILSGNVRDYISIPNIEQVIKVLKQYDKTQYSKSKISEGINQSNVRFGKSLDIIENLLLDLKNNYYGE